MYIAPESGDDDINNDKDELRPTIQYNDDDDNDEQDDLLTFEQGLSLANNPPPAVDADVGQAHPAVDADVASQYIFGRRVAFSPNSISLIDRLMTKLKKMKKYRAIASLLDNMIIDG
jgi:hypothetical protein